MTFPLRHDHPARIAWNALVLCSALGLLLAVTYRLAFNSLRADFPYFAFNLILLADIGSNFVTRRKFGHIRYETFQEIASNYIRGWLLIDLLASFPFILFVIASTWSALFDAPTPGFISYFQLFALVKLCKASRIFDELQESLRIIPSLRRLITVGYWLSILLHIMALGWIIIGAGEKTGLSFDRYLRGVYWVTTTIATIGYGDYVPDHDSNAQVLYTIVVQIFGVAMFSYIIANVSSLMSSLDLARSAFQRRLDEVNAYLRSQRIPGELQDRVRDYYSYLWTKQRGVSAMSVLDELPRNLSQEILMFLNRDLLNKSDIFRGADDLFIRESVQLLRPCVFLPEEYVIRQGEYGDCMYFLTSGEVRILVDGKEVAKLGAGSPFGETALLEDLHRNASVVSTSYSTGYRLPKSNFDELRSKYPEFDRKVRDVAARRK